MGARVKREIDHLLQFLVCPDCKGELENRLENARCTSCGRVFEIFRNTLINILPSKKFVREGKSFVEKRSIEVYDKLFDEPMIWKDDPEPWGLVFPESYRNKLNKHKYMVSKLVPESAGYFCDISTGSGRFSWETAKRSKMAVLCDLSVDWAAYLSQRALSEGLNNIFAVRCDYLQSPFKENVFDLALCNDTLIYGPPHETKLLSSIHSLLKKGGKAVIDISYIYHRGFWHRPYTHAYTLTEMKRMLKDTGFSVKECLPLYYELSKDLEESALSSKLIKLILPPTRYAFGLVK